MHALVHMLLALAAPPFLMGVIGRTKAVFAGRRGPPLLQPYFDLARLFRKGMVVSRTTTWVFFAGPIVGLATALVASLLVPFGNHAAPISFAGDLVLFAYVFGLSRFLTVVAALDTGSPFEGMGAAREATYACLAEPALFLGLLALVRRSGSLSLTGILGDSLRGAWALSGASMLLVFVSLFIVLLAEGCRIPFDDPNTHLELTMIHEVMVLDHSGPMLGAILYGASLKFFVLGAVVARIATPFGSDPWLGWGVFVASMLAVAVAVAVVESVMARVRLLQVPTLLVAACILSAFGIVLLAR